MAEAVVAQVEQERRVNLAVVMGEAEGITVRWTAVQEAHQAEAVGVAQQGQMQSAEQVGQELEGRFACGVGEIMGIVVANTVGLSGIVAPKPNVQIFTSSASPGWTKPPGCSRVYIEVIGGGGAGSGGGEQNGASTSGGGGGGGAMARGVFDADALEPTLDIVVGAAVAGGNGATSVGVGSPGTDGNYSEVHLSSAGTVILKAWGGGRAGAPSAMDAAGAGGGGGGTGGAGVTGSGTTGGNGGNPTVQGSTQGDSLGGRGGKGGNRTTGSGGSGTEPTPGNAEFGGGGGSGGVNGDNPGVNVRGGSSIFGAGGGGGGYQTGTGTPLGGPGQAGGGWMSYALGTGLDSSGGAQSAGTTNSDGEDAKSRSYGCGDGGMGGWSSGVYPATGGDGGDGGTPGGGGGAGGAGRGGGGDGGDGARGEVRIFSW